MAACLHALYNLQERLHELEVEGQLGLPETMNVETLDRMRAQANEGMYATI